MRRTLYTEDHEQYRDTVREFLHREVVPHYERWEQEQLIDRGVLASARKAGLLGLEVPEEFGGSGVHDYRFRAVVCEEAARAHVTSFDVTLGLQDDLVLHYLTDLTTPEQRRRWLPGFATGDVIGALAMTEPGTGSDLQGIRTTAVRDGDAWVLNGQKTFISSGSSADLVIVAARTDPDAGSRGFSLFVVEDGMPGFTRGRKLAKIGLHAQDTAELFFTDVRVPAANLLGGEGRGLANLMSHLPRERMGIVVQAMAGARAVFEDTRRYVFDRRAFGSAVGDFQATRFALAEMATELDVAQAFADQCVLAYNAGELTPVDAAKGKWWISELQKRIVDRCLQLHGGYGYMTEYPVARAFVDTRVQTIYAGTTEIMKEIIGRDLAS
ncbi:acyl-CoA dehydrogenase domain-containing protein [Streptomyces albus]|uniref:Acyl-CoA dehydrogenase domain-containing protein n=1 Tax=Streptomyces albus (strain ATCC 21838 / DSM 41398 / FERM P-419 / JCM 4703 / NBRC 107858) TaxID=1081613 RepID=A0A0B5EQJ2_STRA4|nr:acyl-CoA dehydrogenase domain-containing protein [Streptomyces albus]AOU74747.1 acyl-CoA dehydrogenase domain-containing protein [Streptomyces albus]AYN30557.1 acyl-CoA dehydrogenase [Streptomyces albus]